MWSIAKKNTGSIIAEDFPSRAAAEAYIDKLGPAIGRYYQIQANTGNSITNRLLTEGLVKNDLWKILLPRISVDEFVPGDPETDNVVIAFFLKGVPEATLPFKTFCEQSNGVVNADYGDSETVIGAQNVYVEFDRERIDMSDIGALMIQVAMLSGLEPDDFTMTFPHTDKKFPYNLQTMKEYFISRNEKKNRIAQQRALDKAAAKFEDDLKKARKEQQSQQKPQDVQESFTGSEEIIPVMHQGDEIGSIWQYNGQWHGEHIGTGKTASGSDPKELVQRIQAEHRNWIRQQTHESLVNTLANVPLTG